MTNNDHSRRAGTPGTWADPTPAIEARPSWRRALPLLVWLGCLGIAVALLQALGGGRLAAPSLTDPSSWQAWAAGRDPLELVMVVLRLLALAVSWYLTGVTSVSVVARLLRAARLVRVADALSVGPVRLLVQQALGVGLAAGVMATSVPGVAAVGRAASDTRADVAVMALVEEPQDPVDEPAGPDGEVLSTAGATQQVMVRVPVPAPDASPEPSLSGAPPPRSEVAPSPSPVPVAEPEVAPPAQTSSVTEPTAREVRVRPGDHFWELAEQAVADHLGRPGSEQEVLAHWQAMLAANADRLVVAGNPDLLVPGQSVVVPDVAEVLS